MPETLSSNVKPQLPQQIIDELKEQIKGIAATLASLNETVAWMQDAITSHDYRISELETMMGYDNPNNDDLYPPHNDNEYSSHGNGWDDDTHQETETSTRSQPNFSRSVMDISPDASFSNLDPKSVLTSRHVPLPGPRPQHPLPDATASRLQHEISNVTSVQQNLSVQLGSIMDKLDSFSAPNPNDI
jgi:peptidoglycan hydrolase CwlO-like protein